MLLKVKVTANVKNRSPSDISVTVADNPIKWTVTVTQSLWLMVSLGTQRGYFSVQSHKPGYICHSVDELKFKWKDKAATNRFTKSASVCFFFSIIHTNCYIWKLPLFSCLCQFSLVLVYLHAKYILCRRVSYFFFFFFLCGYYLKELAFSDLAHKKRFFV